MWIMDIWGFIYIQAAKAQCGDHPVSLLLFDIFFFIIKCQRKENKRLLVERLVRKNKTNGGSVLFCIQEALESFCAWKDFGPI